MKRLLCILNNMNSGGAETFLMKLYRALDKTQYQMDFCINVPEHCFYEDEILTLGGQIYRIPSKSESFSAFCAQLSDLVCSQHYRYVLRITSNAAGFLDLKLAKKAGAACCIARSSNSSDGDSLKSAVVHRLGRLFCQSSVDVMLAPSDLAAQYTFGKRAYQRGTVSILHNGIDLNIYRFDPQARAEIRRSFAIGKHTHVFGHIGRFMQQKNHAFLLDVFAECLKRAPDSVLLLVGKGELEEQIREKAALLGLSDRILFTGVRSDVPALLSAMDCFVFPSFYEGMPNTVIEAQATGLPCVISDRITREADLTGLVHYLPLGNAEKWADAALSCIGAERTDTREAFIRQQYDIESVTQQFARLVFGEES